MDCGKKIAALRKSQNMTQEELGKVLSVTYQAVSKWERGESLPDFEMMSRIAKFFNVPLNYFTDEDDGAQTETAVAATAEAVPTANVVGMCTQCGKMLTEDEIARREPKIICKSCSERLKEQAEKERAANEAKERARKDRAIFEQRGNGVDLSLIISVILSLALFIGLAVLGFKYAGDSTLVESAEGIGLLIFFVPLAVFGGIQAFCDFVKEERSSDYSDPEWYTRNVSLVVAGIFAVANLAVFLALYIMTKSGLLLGLMFASTICSFTFVSQFLWGGVIKEIFTAGGFTFQLPGFIITLDIDSILWMIIVKFLLGILAVIIFVVTTVVVAAVAIFVSLVMFIPSILHKSVKDKQVEKENK